MIVVDSSALIAVLEGEPEALAFVVELARAERLFVSAVSVLETGMVLRARRGDGAIEDLRTFLFVDNDFEVVPFDQALAESALAAFSRFGKGINPRARLNLGDCATYALAKAMDLPLLFKGDDFTSTDVRRVR